MSRGKNIALHKTSKVLTIRVKNWVIAACFDISERQVGEAATVNLSMATIVNNTLESLFRVLIESDSLPSYSDDTLADRVWEIQKPRLDAADQKKLADFVRPKSRKQMTFDDMVKEAQRREELKHAEK